MRIVIVIDHESYGPDAVECTSLQEAQRALRGCGSDFADTTLEMCGNGIYDERDELVGTVEERI